MSDREQAPGTAPAPGGVRVRLRGLRELAAGRGAPTG